MQLATNLCLVKTWGLFFWRERLGLVCTELLRFVSFLLCASFVFLLGCSDSAPQGPKKGAIQAYLDEHPEARSRVDEEGEADVRQSAP